MKSRTDLVENATWIMKKNKENSNINHNTKILFFFLFLHDHHPPFIPSYSSLVFKLLLILQLAEYGFAFGWAPVGWCPCSGKLLQYCSVGESWKLPGGVGVAPLGYLTNKIFKQIKHENNVRLTESMDFSNQQYFLRMYLFLRFPETFLHHNFV